MAISKKQRIATKAKKVNDLLKQAQKDAKAKVSGAPERIAIHEASLDRLRIRPAPGGAGPTRV